MRSQRRASPPRGPPPPLRGVLAPAVAQGGRACSRCPCWRSWSSTSARSWRCSSSSFWQVDAFTGKVVHDWTLDNFSTIIHDSVYRQIVLRTILMAAAVTLTDAVLAFPLAYFMARIATSSAAVGAVRAGAPAPVVELPRADLLLAADPGEERRAQLGAELDRPAGRRPRLHEHGDVDRLLVRLAAVHDPAGLRGARADPAELPRGLGRSRRPRLADVPAASSCRSRCPA